MKIFHALLISFATLLVTFQSNASDNTNAETDRKKINIVSGPSNRPHMIEVAEPEAYYTISTATLSIELDPVEYAEFTIILSTAYANIDYVVTSATVNIPVGALDDVIEIYIESDDCGCYYGVLDQSAYSNTY